jgi:hypothetical protein
MTPGPRLALGFLDDDIVLRRTAVAYTALTTHLAEDDEQLLRRMQGYLDPGAMGRKRCLRCPISDLPGYEPLPGPCRVPDLAMAARTLEAHLAATAPMEPAARSRKSVLTLVSEGDTAG